MRSLALLGVYLASNSFTLHLPDGTEETEHGRAFHSMYFEILGEQGYVELAIFTGMVALFFWTMTRLSQKAKIFPELEWLRDLAHALMTFAVVYMCGGAFVGISFQPLLYYVLALGICLGQYYRRCLSVPVRLPGREAHQGPFRSASGAKPSAARSIAGPVPPWRQRPPVARGP